MSFRAQKIRFLVDFSFASRYFGLSNFTAHSFSTTRNTFEKKAASNPQASEFFLCFVVKFFIIQLWVKTAFHS